MNEDEAFRRGVVEELARRYEADRPNGWRPESLPADFYERMLRAIVAFEMPATRLEGKFKLGQNRSVEDRRRPRLRVSRRTGLERRRGSPSSCAGARAYEGETVPRVASALPHSEGGAGLNQDVGEQY